MKASKARQRVALLLVCAACLLPWGARAASTNQLSTTNDVDYKTALAAIDAQDYNTALVYLNNALTSNSQNGYVYLERSKLDLLYYLPSNAVSDATTAVAYLRASDTCDQFLQSDNPLLLASSNTYNTLGLTSSLTGLSGYGSVLNLTSINGLSSTGTSTASGSTTTGTTGTTTTGTTGTTSGTGTTSSTTSSSTSSSSSTASSGLFASSSGSTNLPVAEDLTDKDKEKNETMNEYNEMATQMALYSSYCGGIYLNNLTALVDGYTSLGRGYLLGKSYALAQRGFTAALELDESDAKAAAGLGLAYLGQGASSAALTELNLAVTYAPSEPAAYVARGAYWVSIGDYARANEEYEAAVGLDASYLAAYASLGLLRALQGNYKYALEAYDKGLSLNANYVIALVGRAASWASLAATTTDTSLAATYEKNAENDLTQAQKLQNTAATATSTSYSSGTSSLVGTSYSPSSTTTSYASSSLPYTTASSSTSTTTSTLSVTAPVLGTFY
jgi:Tfp pilus assembly protein PilF